MARFHEYGCYLGLVSAVILGVRMFGKKFFKENLKLILLFVFFFWIASGWIEAINPWKIFSNIPLLNNVHIASRLFIVVFLLALILLAKIFDGWKDRSILYWGLIAFLLVEAVFVRNYPFYKLFTVLPARPHLNRLITSDNIDRTDYYARIPYNFYKQNTGSQETYDPAKFYTPVKNSNDINYRGEIYRCDGMIADKNDELKVVRYIPGEIDVRYRMKTPGCIELNTNNLFGWKVSKGEAKIQSQKIDQLLSFTTRNNEGEVVLKYSPSYLLWTFPLFIMGILSAIFYWCYLRKKHVKDYQI